MNQGSDDAATVHITTMRVTGIRCGGCAAYIGRMLEGVSGVVHVDVRQRPGDIVVEHLPAFVDAGVIAASIRQLGYGAEVHTTVPDFAADEGVSSSCRCRARTNENHEWWNLGISTTG